MRTREGKMGKFTCSQHTVYLCEDVTMKATKYNKDALITAVIQNSKSLTLELINKFINVVVNSWKFINAMHRGKQVKMVF